VIWQVGVLLVGIGLFIVCLIAAFILLNLTRSLRTLEAILGVTLEEVRLALPELRHSLQQVDDMVTSVNDKFSAADRAIDATGAAITNWRSGLRQRLSGLTGRFAEHPRSKEMEQS
jgi:hypothetical protein